MTIKEYLKESVLITDGAMGTWYDHLYHGEGAAAEEANLSHPERILQIHKDYIGHGARLLRTNTFALNEETAGQFDRGGLSVWDYIRKNLAKAVEIAREAAAGCGEDVYVAADIGPIPEKEEAKDREYLRLIDFFLQEGMDLFVLETFPDTRPVALISSYIKQKNPNAFVLAQFAVNPTGYSQMGHSVRRILREAGEIKALDGCGLNCGIGVSHMLRFLKGIKLPAGKFLSALPNCGYPHVIRGRTIYSDSVSYYGERMEQIVDLGVNLIGGCCGTTPSYIGELAGRFAKKKPTARKHYGEEGGADKAVCWKFPLIQKMDEGKKVIAVELDPPFDADPTKLMEGAFYLKEKGVDMITIADSPMARARADSFLVASRLMQDVGIPVLPHLACRDRNRINIRSVILGGYINQIRNILVVTGDPVGSADKEVTKGVFDFNSIRLMEFIRSMNEEHFFMDPICVGGALNQNSASLTAVAARMKKKIAAGASFFLTQPVYDDEGAEKIRFLKKETGAKILCGIMPLVSYRNAMFMRNEMPGIHVPEKIAKRYRPDMTKDEADTAALEICRELIEKLQDIADGYYFMTPFNRADLIGRMIEYVRPAKAKR